MTLLDFVELEVELLLLTGPYESIDTECDDVRLLEEVTGDTIVLLEDFELRGFVLITLVDPYPGIEIETKEDVLELLAGDTIVVLVGA